MSDFDYSVAITANRLLTLNDHSTIFKKMLELVLDENVRTIYFGGAIGGDTVALKACLDAVCMNRPRLIVVVPCKLEHQPWATRDVSRQADEIIELGNPITNADGYASYKTRNCYMVDHAKRCVGFWSGDKKSGTWHCLNYAQTLGREVEIVTIEGKDKA